MAQPSQAKACGVNGQHMQFQAPLQLACKCVGLLCMAAVRWWLKTFPLERSLLWTNKAFGLHWHHSLLTNNPRPSNLPYRNACFSFANSWFIRQIQIVGHYIYIEFKTLTMKSCWASTFWIIILDKFSFEKQKSTPKMKSHLLSDLLIKVRPEPLCFFDC